MSTKFSFDESTIDVTTLLQGERVHAVKILSYLALHSGRGRDVVIVVHSASLCRCRAAHVIVPVQLKSKGS